MDLYTSTPRPTRDDQMFNSSSNDISDVTTLAVSPKSSSITEDKVKAKKSSKILDLICEAIKEIGVARKGASYNSIKKYVIEHDQKEKSAKLFLTLFKRSFVRGMEQKLFIRKDSSQVTGLRGYFVLPKEPKVKANKTPTLPKQVAKSRPTKPVSNVVSLARKKKKMAIMNGSLILKRNSILLNEVKKSTVSAKAKKVKNTKSEDALEEPGPASAKGSKKEPKLLAEKQVKAATRRKKQTKTVASDIDENRQVQKTKAVAKKTSKTIDPAKKQSKTTTKKQAEPKKPQAAYKAKILDKTEAPTRKQKTVSSDETEVTKRKQMKTASSDQAEAPAKKHPKTKASSKKNLKTKTPTESKSEEVFKEVNFTSSDEAATDEQMKSASSDETEVPIKKVPKTKAPPKKNIKTKELSDREVSAKEMMNTSGEVEVSTIKQMKTVPPDESGSLAKRQQKKKAEKSPNGVPRKQMKTSIPDEDGNQQNDKVPAKKQPKGAAQASGSKKQPKNETYIKQPKVVTEKEKKSKKKEVSKLIDKVKGRKNLRKDLSDSELDVSTRTKPLKSYHSDPEVSMMGN